MAENKRCTGLDQLVSRELILVGPDICPNDLIYVYFFSHRLSRDQDAEVNVYSTK